MAWKNKDYARLNQEYSQTLFEHKVGFRPHLSGIVFFVLGELIFISA